MLFAQKLDVREVVFGEVFFVEDGEVFVWLGLLGLKGMRSRMGSVLRHLYSCFSICRWFMLGVTLGRRGFGVISIRSK